MQSNIGRIILLLLLCTLTGCTSPTKRNDWTRIQVGQTDKKTILQWFGEPQDKYTEPRGFSNQPAWEIWLYDGGIDLWFQNNIVTKFFLPWNLDPLLKDGYTVEQMLAEYGLPEVVYEYYTELEEGKGITSWSFVYPTRGDEFVIMSWFPIVSGRNRPPPPTLRLMGRYRWIPTDVEDWLNANNERRIEALKDTRIEDIGEYFGRMDPNAPFRDPVMPLLPTLPPPP